MLEHIVLGSEDALKRCLLPADTFWTSSRQVYNSVYFSIPIAIRQQKPYWKATIISNQFVICRLRNAR